MRTIHQTSVSVHSATVFGGTGYRGQHVVRRLVKTGYRVRVAVRHPRANLFQNMGGAVQQTQADVSDVNSIAGAIEGAEGVVNTVGLYVEKGAASFGAVHAAGARAVAEQSANIARMGSDPFLWRMSHDVRGFIRG
ncbi:MAG: NmrA family NAD(P)-binding protein [Gammaproteobacteria bacterium]|nr:NmrA family NAD(P)-binding protein [Gammaproteobacteria bacterium]